MELQSNFELQNPRKYNIRNELPLKNCTTGFQIPTPIKLGIIRSWTQLYSIYIDLHNAILMSVKSILTYDYLNLKEFC